MPESLHISKASLHNVQFNSSMLRVPCFALLFCTSDKAMAHRIHGVDLLSKLSNCLMAITSPIFPWTSVRLEISLYMERFISF